MATTQTLTEISPLPADGILHKDAKMQAPNEIDQPSANGLVHKPVESQTSIEHDPPLFAQSLISPEVSANLQELGYSIRPLRRSDYNTGKIQLPIGRGFE